MIVGGVVMVGEGRTDIIIGTLVSHSVVNPSYPTYEGHVGYSPTRSLGAPCRCRCILQNKVFQA